MGAQSLPCSRMPLLCLQVEFRDQLECCCDQPLRKRGFCAKITLLLRLRSAWNRLLHILARTTIGNSQQSQAGSSSLGDGTLEPFLLACLQCI
jgi:hypothetical protein